MLSNRILFICLFVVLSISLVKGNGEFSPELAYNGLVMSYSAYCFGKYVNYWSCPFEHPTDSCGNPLSGGFFNASEDKVGRFDFIYQEAVSDSLFYIAEQDNNYYLVFRGTDDIINDMEDIDFAHQKPFPQDDSSAMVSKGFYVAWRGGFMGLPPVYIDQLRQPVMDALASTSINSGSGLTIVGHSFGGAMASMSYMNPFTNHASLAALEFSTINDEQPELPYGPITVYTYGSPRVGNEDFEVLFNTNTNIETSYRVVNFEDTIPHLPLPAFTLFGSNATYSHVNTEVWLYNYSNDPSQYPVYLECPLTEQLNCSTNSLVHWTQFDNMTQVMYYHRRYFAYDLETFCQDWIADLEVLQHPTIFLNITRHWMAGGYNYTNVVGTLTNNGPVDIANPVFTSNPNIVPVAGIWGLTPTTTDNGIIHWRLTPLNGVTPTISIGSEYIFAFTYNSTATYSFTRIK
ncbi:hypothetical protein DFA_03782 [Cavenderia fasciculata]|uniref:Fungal lipase-type domain-containing protein n=1 Tax=Cavenderia fasciculata TaxID=261658 RepID=F4Q0D7_CACFS|nr:uncharacterized protein DFA_03782 [Cavenderia fasciculata]EGG18288.1 hypothetical protein DFA_03782 [Cavenderia fasciculata]|eukprot:XP_004357111.1 hypothetical protein DFA_03782 [Cavenderia fasciculata]